MINPEFPTQPSLSQKPFVENKEKGETSHKDEIIDITNKIKLDENLTPTDTEQEIDAAKRTHHFVHDALETTAAPVSTHLFTASPKGEAVPPTLTKSLVSPADKTSELVPKAVDKPKINLTIGFFCDIDGVDHNGIIRKDLERCIDQGFPFITTRSLLQGTGIENPKQRLSTLVTFQEKIFAQNDKWEVFQQGEFIVFLPKILLPDKTGAEKLRDLDFVTDGKLKQIPIAQAFQLPEDKGNIEDLFKLFVDEPKCNKLFYLSGHGDPETVGALEGANYQKFLEFLGKQHCKGLTVDSCYSGGRSSLMATQSDMAFTMIVRNMGEFSSVGDQSAEQDIKTYFDELTQFVESSSAPTTAELRKVINSVEKSGIKSRKNFMQVYFPSSKGVQGGLRTVGEHGTGYSLTYNKAKQYELSSQQPFAKQGLSSEILLTNKEALDIFPSVVQTPIVIKGLNPILMSMIPGDSQHFLKSIQTDTLASDFFSTTINFYKNDFEAKKGFFIGEIHAGNETLTEVSLLITSEGSECVYRKEGKYYFTDGSQEKEITAYQYSLALKKAVVSTIPGDASLVSATAGYETVKNFEVAFTPVFTHTLIPPSSSKEDKQAQVFASIERGDQATALEILKSEKIDPNILNYNNKPLILYAIENNADEILKYLLDQKVDWNLNYNKTTPLHYAIWKGNPKIIEIFTNDSSFIEACKEGFTPFYKTNAHNSTPLELAFSHPSILKLLIDKGVNINGISGAGFTPLSWCASKNKNKEIDLLLQAGADPNLGKPSALVQAVYQNDIHMVKKFISAKGNPFGPDEQGNIPFIEALMFASPEIVNVFLEHKDCDVNVKDAQGKNPLLGAIISGNQEKIQALIAKGAKFDIDYSEFSLVKNALAGLVLSNQTAIIVDLLKYNRGNSKEFENLALDILLIKNPDIITDLIVNKFVKIEIQFISNVIVQADKNYAKYKDLLHICLKQIDNVDQEFGYGSTLLEKSQSLPVIKDLIAAGADGNKQLFKILNIADLDLIKQLTKDGKNITPELIQRYAGTLKPNSPGDIFKWLVEKGADLNTVDQTNHTPFAAVILSGNLSLVEFCLQHGANLHPIQKGQTLPLEWAAQVQNDPEGKIFKKLVALGCDMNSPGTLKSTPFAMLASKASPEIIQWALAKGAEPNPSNPSHKETPLQAAAGRTDDPQKILFKQFVEAGANMNAEVSNEMTSPIASIFATGNPELVKWCLSHGAVLHPNKVNFDALHASVQANNEELISLVLQNPPAAEPSQMGTLYIDAYKAGGKKLLERMLNWSSDGSQLTDGEKNDLWNAAYRDIDTVRILLEKKISPIRSDGTNLLQNFAIFGNREDLLDLIDDFNLHVDLNAIPGMHEIISSDDIKKIKFLLNHGLDPNQKIEDIPLIFFCRSKEIMQLFLEKGADPNSEYQEMTPLRIAISSDDPELVRLVLKNGGKINDDMRQLAQEKGNSEIINLLK